LLLKSVTVGAVALLSHNLLLAAETNAYVNGTSGILGGSVPPPGKYYVMYNRLYRSADFKDGSGDAARTDDGRELSGYVSAFANAHRFIHVTDYKIAGADFMWNLVVPAVWVDLDIGAYGISDSSSGFGDLNLEPFVIQWHDPRWDVGFVYGVYAPTGRRDDNRPALPGKNFWTHYAGIGATYFFDDARSWSFSILSRYEIHTTRKHKDIRAGDDFSFEWGLGKQIEPGLQVGISGYAQWQVSDDTGSDVDYDASVHDRVFGIGPELHYVLPGTGIQMQARWWTEFDAVDRPEGSIATVTFATRF
jgi:hypothetical protein